MNEGKMNLEMTCEEHEILVSAVIQMLDAYYALYDYREEDPDKVRALKSVSKKLTESWQERFDHDA